jgi:hypothetical protein
MPRSCALSPADCGLWSKAAIAAGERTAREASQNVGHACTNTDHAAATMIQALGSVRDLLAKLSFA